MLQNRCTCIQSLNHEADFLIIPYRRSIQKNLVIITSYSIIEKQMIIMFKVNILTFGIGYKMLRCF